MNNLLIAIVILLILGGLLSFLLVEVAIVRGNELGVKETWTSGVDPNVYQPKSYFLFPNWAQDMYKYDMTPQIFVMNNKDHDERAGGRKNDSYIARSSDNQTLILELALQWHYDPLKIVDIHKRYKTHTGMRDWSEVIEERVIRQNLMGAVNTAITSRTAIDAYSGEGFVEAQKKIFDTLADPNGELRSQGIIVENFVIEKVTFEDKNYIQEINQRQVAQQRELRANQETKAALAEAQRSKAEAQSDYEKRVVEANRDKEVQVLASQAAAQQQINAARAQGEQVTIAAKAQAEQVTVAAEANRIAAEADAAAILARGKAEAEAQKLRLQAYAVPGADAFVKIEVSKNMAEAFKNVKGYLPGDMKINLLSGNFMDAVDALVGKRTPVAN